MNGNSSGCNALRRREREREREGAKAKLDRSSFPTSLRMLFTVMDVSSIQREREKAFMV